MISFSDGKRLIAELFILGSYEDTPVNQIIDLLKSADELYFNDTESFIEDAQYDALKQYAQRLAPGDVYFTGVGSEVRGGKVKLPYTMGSLDQIQLGDYTKWINNNNLNEELLVITDKLDGASNMILYGTDGKLQIAYSRGDGLQGADITRHIGKIHNVPLRIDNGGIPIAIRAETIISPEQFANMKENTDANRREYKNPRNAVSGMMNSSENDPTVYLYIDVIAYEILDSPLSKLDQLKKLKQLGFSTVRYSSALAKDMDDNSWTDLLARQKKFSPYELDGLVIEVNEPSIRSSLVKTSSSINPAYAVKFKVADASNVAQAIVKEVEWNTSKDGYLKPRVRIEPINLVGVTIQHATGFNAKFIRDNQIGPGAVIKITRSGDVIPFILETISPSPTGAQLPLEQASWTDTDVDLVIDDVANNQIVKYERLIDFFQSLDVPHLADGNLKKMFDMGFDTPEEIISLTQEDIGSLVGSQIMGKKIAAGLRTKLTNIPLYTLMGAHSAFGRGIGIRKMKKLWEAFEGNMSMLQDPVQIADVDGFDDKSATKISNGYNEFMIFYEKIKRYVSLSEFVAKPIGKMTGQTVVFTGFRSNELETQIEQAGGTIGSGVSGKTTILACANPSENSTKLQKARNLNITIVSIEQLKGML